MPPGRVGDAAPEPPPLRTEAEITAHWSDGPPAVSVLCLTHQHAPFLEDALRGILGQRTVFPFEVLILDDGSSDGTTEIARDHAHRYPGIIRPVLDRRGGDGSRRTFAELTELSSGAFIAYCEGDDYWFGDDHLAELLGAIRTHPGASAAVGPTIIVEDGIVTGHELPRADGWNVYLPLRSLLHRRDAAVPWIPPAHGDMRRALALQRAGQVVVLDRPRAVYRRHAGGMVSGASRGERKGRLVAGLIAIAVHLEEEGDLDLARHYQRVAVSKVQGLLGPPRSDRSADDRVGLRAMARRAIRRRIAPGVPSVGD